MTAKAKLLGYPISYLDDEWVFDDTGEPTATTYRLRPCRHCNEYCDESGHDPCIKNTPGVMNACCGHGDVEEAYVQFDSSEIIGGEYALYLMNELRRLV